MIILSWRLKPYLEALVTMLHQAVPIASLSQVEALALIAQLIGAANYFVVSQPTLRSMFGAVVFDGTRDVYERELRAMVRARLAVYSMDRSNVYE